MTKKYQKTVPDATALAVPEQVSIAIQPMLATREERLAGAETRVRAPRGDQQHEVQDELAGASSSLGRVSARPHPPRKLYRSYTAPPSLTRVDYSNVR